MIVAFAGRRPGSEDFPDEHVEQVGARIEQLLGGLRPRRLVGSAAAGADLLVLEAAERLGIDADVVIVGGVEAFRESSVADKGGDWGDRYDHQLSRLEPEILAAADRPDAGYRAVTDRIAERAATLLETDEALVVLAVSRPGRGGNDETEALARHGAAPGRLVLRIDPSLRDDDRPRAFVAMPFGDKPYAERGWQHFSADLSYQRIMIPALVDAGYRALRADTDALLEIIDHTMLREINRAPVMLVDLAMLNANVMWELGLRHAWRRSATILMAPEWVKNPFDIQRVPVFSYVRDAQEISDADTLRAIETLQRALRSAGEGRVDSPVFANINELADVELPEPPATAGDGAGELLAAATLAGDRRDVEELLRVATRVRGAVELRPVSRTALLEQIGLRLVPLDRYAEALELLAPLAEADTGLERRRLQEQYAHVLIRADALVPGDERLAKAEGILNALRARYGPAGETLGLLGSAAKTRVERAVAAGDPPPAVHLSAAIRAYRGGLEADPGDAYPGINAVALLRLRGQRWGGAPRDLDDARSLLPVVRFAAGRPEAAADLWSRLTVAECDLHAYFLDGDPERLESSRTAYTDAAGEVEPGQRRSAGRQLRLMRQAGDPADVLDPLLELFA